MGVVLSVLTTLGVAIKILLKANDDLQEILKRASQPPGLPNPKPTASYWLDDPPYPELVVAQSAVLPGAADIVIIGSGITGAAVAWAILQQYTSATDGADSDGRHAKRAGYESSSSPPRVVVLEARSLCSGATGRNGGHIKPSPHETFKDLKDRIGPARAAELVRFQLRHVKVLPKLCAGQGWDVAECRQVRTSDMFVNEKQRDHTFAQVRDLAKWVPECEIDCLGAEEAQKVGFPSPKRSHGESASIDRVKTWFHRHWAPTVLSRAPSATQPVLYGRSALFRASGSLSWQIFPSTSHLKHTLL